MKKTIAFFISCFFIIGVTAQVYNYPDTTPSGHVLYYNIDNGEAEVTYKSYNYPNYRDYIDSTLIIPDSIMYDSMMYPVTSIGYQAFAYAEMDSVVIPNTVRTIGMWAFGPCPSLKEVIIPNSVTEIGQGAFGGCYSIVSVTLPDSITSIASQTFDADTSLVSIIIPDAVTTIGSAAFSQCYSLRKVTFGHSLISINNGAFSHGKHLDSLIFLNDVAPWIGNIFYTDTLHLVIDIPCGSYHSYYPIFGSNHTYIVPSVELSMTVSSASPDWGTAQVVPDADQQDVRCDSSSVIQAIPNYGYHFTGWSNGSMVNPDTLVIDRDSTLLAGFAKNHYTVEVQSSDSTIGSVSGGGEFDYLDSAYITASAIAHHHLVAWSNGSRDTSLAIEVTQDRVFIAYFAIDTHCVFIATDNIEQGNVYGNEVFSNGIGYLPYGAVVTILAVPQAGYQFDHWSDGSMENPYIFPVFEDKDLTAYFVSAMDIDDIAESIICLSLHNNTIVVSGTHGETIRVFDTMGRCVAVSNSNVLNVPHSGVYMVKIGNLPARKVVVFE